MLKQTSPLRWRSAEEWTKDWLECATLATRLPVLDSLLYRGGLPHRYLTMLYGHPGAGKTQLAMHCAIQAATHDSDPVVVIDTHNTWKTRRLYQMTEALGIANPDKILDNIIIEYESDFINQFFFIRRIIDEVKASFVCLDTIISTKIEDTVRFRNHIEDLALLARKQSIPLLLVNQIYDKPTSSTESRLIPRQGTCLAPWTPIWIELQNTSPHRRGQVFLYQQLQGQFILDIGATLSIKSGDLSA